MIINCLMNGFLKGLIFTVHFKDGKEMFCTIKDATENLKSDDKCPWFGKERQAVLGCTKYNFFCSQRSQLLGDGK